MNVKMNVVVTKEKAKWHEFKGDEEREREIQ